MTCLGKLMITIEKIVMPIIVYHIDNQIAQLVLWSSAIDTQNRPYKPGLRALKDLSFVNF